jgi:similar to stage IV sporulation protein
VIAWIWQFIAGYVKIKLEGLKLLQFINDAAEQGIILKNTERHAYCRITATVSFADYKRLCRLSRNRPLRVAAVFEGGLPHLGGLALKRLVFTVGLVACIAALAVTNLFVLEVRVNGCTSPELRDKVYQITSAGGVKPGIAKSELDLHACEQSLMLKLPEISFAAIRVSGVVASVNIVEAVKPPQLIDKNTPCNIVASCDAVVRKLVVYNGQPQVAVDDVVRRGQVLVAGQETLLEGTRQVHARADVFASTWVEGKGSALLFSEKVERTGEACERRRLECAGYIIPIGEQGLPAFEDYEITENVYYLLGDSRKGPRLVVTRYEEVRRSAEARDIEQARQEAQDQAEQQGNAALSDSSREIDRHFVITMDKDTVLARLYIEILDNIAVEAPLR